METAIHEEPMKLINAPIRAAAGAGGRYEGSLDFAKLEPAIRGTPVVESHTTRGFFPPVLSNRIREPHLTI